MGDDESGPADARMMWILSADDANDDDFKLDLNAELTPQELTYFRLKLTILTTPFNHPISDFWAVIR